MNFDPQDNLNPNNSPEENPRITITISEEKELTTWQQIKQAIRIWGGLLFSIVCFAWLAYFVTATFGAPIGMAFLGGLFGLLLHISKVD